MSLQPTALVVFLILFLAVTLMGFAAARWHRPAALVSIDEWGLGGRSFGGFVIFFFIVWEIY